MTAPRRHVVTMHQDYFECSVCGDTSNRPCMKDALDHPHPHPTAADHYRKAEG